MRDGALLNAAESIVDLLESDPSTSPSPRLSALSQRFAALTTMSSAPAGSRYRVEPEGNLVTPIESKEAEAERDDAAAQRERSGSDDTAVLSELISAPPTSKRGNSSMQLSAPPAPTPWRPDISRQRRWL